MKTILFNITIALLFTLNVYSQTNDPVINNLYAEIKAVRNNPCDPPGEYKYDLCDFEPTNTPRFSKQLSFECQIYADYICRMSKLKNSHPYLVHSPNDVICNESLAWVRSPYEAVQCWINEEGYDGDGHRLHVLGAERVHKTDKELGIGYVRDEVKNMYYVVMRTR